MRHVTVVAALLAGFGSASLWAQTPSRPVKPPVSTSGTVRVVPNAEYEAGWLHRFLLGTHHRALWATPLDVEVLDLATFAGGLTPLRRGGGMQTQSLRLRGADGRTYVFRSLDKDPARNLSPELRASIAARVLRDQTSAVLPFAALAVEPLFEAASALHTSARVVLMPDDPRLGEHRAEFAGMLGMIEERPESNAEASFQGAANVVSSERMLERIEENANERVDAHAYLTARLLDVLIGDVDRHPDQWRWAGFRDTTGMIWRPVPRDRDFAFTRLDGLIVQLASAYAFPQFVSFGERYPSMFRLTWSGRALDRRLLTGLSRATWDSVAAALQRQITDERIDDAIRRLPVPYQDQVGDELRRSLIARRDSLHVAAAEFYRLLAGWVDVHLTDAADSAVVQRLADGGLELRASTAIDGRRTQTYQRRFHPEETREVRLFLHGGADVALVSDEADRASSSRRGITMRVIGGGGADELRDRAAAPGATSFYDSRGDNRFSAGRSTRVDTRPYEEPPAGSHGARPRDWGALWVGTPLVSYSSDFGLVVGASATRIGYGFRRFPEASKLGLRVGYGTVARAARGEASLELTTSSPTVRLVTNARGSAIDKRHFYGFGNAAAAPLPRESYDVPRTELSLRTAVRVRRGALSLETGPELWWTETRAEPGSFFAAAPPYGAGGYLQLGAGAVASLSAIDSTAAGPIAWRVAAAGRLFPSILDVTGTFGSARLEATGIWTLPLPGEPALALRGRGERVWGRFPWHEAAFLGGEEALRGFPQQRFAGDASLLGSAELRLQLAELYVLFPERVGVLALADAGRVFLNGDSPGGWHTGTGGGVWLSLIDRSLLFSLSVARSAEFTGVYFKAGFSF
jgi:hypothetical protein